MFASMGYFNNSSSKTSSFKWILISVSAIHCILLGFLLFGSFSKKIPQKVTLLQLLPQGSLIKGNPHVVPASTSTPMAPSPTQSTSPALPLKSEIKPTPKPTASEPIKKQTPAKPSVQINLNEVKRSVASPRPNLKPVSRPITSSPVSPPSPTSTPSTSSSINASEIKNRLQARVGKAGVMSATADGQSGAWNGSTSSSEASTYFVLIRDVYYQAWQQPIVDLTQKWATILKIRVNKQGQVLSAKIEQSSGYAPLDTSVKQVARLVKSIGSPLPDVLGTQFADISIVFEF